MSINVLAMVSIGGIFILIVLCLVYVGIPVLIISFIIRFGRYLRNAGKERTLLRMELGKLAEEVHLLRQELKGGKEQDSSAKSE